MKTLITLLSFMLLLAGMSKAQDSKLLESFDTFSESTTDYTFKKSIHADKGSLTLTNLNAGMKEGTGCLAIQYATQAPETWGGGANFDMVVKGSDYWDCSGYKYLSFWYKNIAKQGKAGAAHFRVTLFDANDTSVTVTEGDGYEKWYTFNDILDETTSDWVQVKIALADSGTLPGGPVFNGGCWYTGWSGQSTGNKKLDLTKIKGINIEISDGRASDETNNAGQIWIDKLELTGSTIMDLESFDDFDESTTNYTFKKSIHANKGSLTLTNLNAGMKEGAGCLSVQYSTQAPETWGGGANFDMVLKGEQVWDLEGYEAISFWYKNIMTQGKPGAAHFRVTLFDATDTAVTVTEGDGFEKWYTFNDLLDETTADWQQCIISLADSGTLPGGPVFNGGCWYTGWSGQSTGNKKLDLSKIKGVNIEFSDGRASDETNNTGQIWIDNLQALANNPLSVRKVKYERNAVNIYPNPARDVIYFKSNNISAVSIYSITGKLVKRVNEPGVESIPVHDLTTGIYIVNIVSNGVSSVQKLIVE